MHERCRFLGRHVCTFYVVVLYKGYPYIWINGPGGGVGGGRGSLLIRSGMAAELEEFTLTGTDYGDASMLTRQLAFNEQKRRRNYLGSRQEVWRRHTF